MNLPVQGRSAASGALEDTSHRQACTNAIPLTNGIEFVQAFFARIMLKPDKAALRKSLRARRKALGGFHRFLAMRRIESRLERLTRRLSLTAVAAYCAFDGEPELDGWFRRHRGHIWLPRVLPDYRLAFHHADPPTACSRRRMPRTNRFGIIESADPRRRGINSLDALLIPLVGFDTRGNRLGMGAGFYDRALAKRRGLRPVAIGVAFSCQEVDALPVDPWDEPLDYIVTDRGVIDARRTAGRSGWAGARIQTQRRDPWPTG